MHPAVFSRFCRNSEKYVRVIKCCKESCQTNNKLAIRDFWQIFRAFTALFKCKCVSPHFLSFISSAAQKMSILYRVSISRYIVCWSRGNNSRSCYREILSIFIGKGMIEKKKEDFLLCAPALQMCSFGSFLLVQMRFTDRSYTWPGERDNTAIFFGTEKTILSVLVSQILKAMYWQSTNGIRTKANEIAR